MTLVSGFQVVTRPDAANPDKEDFAYYVERYGARPPDDLLRRARTGSVPEMRRERLDEVITWMQQGMPEDE